MEFYNKQFRYSIMLFIYNDLTIFIKFYVSNVKPSKVFLSIQSSSAPL